MKKSASLLAGLVFALAANTASALEIDTSLGSYSIDVRHLENEYFASIGAISVDGTHHLVLFFHNNSSTIPSDALYNDAYGTVYSHYSADRFADMKALFREAAAVRMVYDDTYNSLILQVDSKVGATDTSTSDGSKKNAK